MKHIFYRVQGKADSLVGGRCDVPVQILGTQLEGVGKNPLHSTLAAVWWFYLLAYGAFPLWLSSDLYQLFVGVSAPCAQYWFYVLLVPVACQLPDFFLRMAKK